VIYFCSGCTAYNLGTGRGTSVLEMVAAFEKASGKVNYASSSRNELLNGVRMVKFYIM